MRVFLAIILTMLGMIPGSLAVAQTADPGAAREYCDTTTLEPIEGIWKFPSDDTRVLIQKSDEPTEDFRIIVLTTPDCRLTPGQRIGSIRATAQSGTYELSICRELSSDGILSDPTRCVASLKDNDASLTFKPLKLSASLRTVRYFTFLPNFWKALRFSFKDPQATVPDGMVRVYPVPYGSRLAPKIHL